VGAHLWNAEAAGVHRLVREGNNEVDFVVQVWRRITAIEVKSGRTPQVRAGTAAFGEAFKVHCSLLVGGDGMSVEEFLAPPVPHGIGS
jgi:hypothetical protein